jgi:hypothetical protein
MVFDQPWTILAGVGVCFGYRAKKFLMLDGGLFGLSLAA